jgi:[ribosomal protein S18]-alanine N-acetyltransferase
LRRNSGGFRGPNLTSDTRHLTPDSSDTFPLTPVLRGVRPEDFEALYRLDQICFEEGIAYSREELARFLSIPSAEGVVAERCGEIAGFSIGYLSRGRVAHVVTLDVHPERRRGGLGAALLEELLGLFSDAGASEARLEVSTENSGAIAFYEKLGFQRRRALRDYYGPGRNAFEMGRLLAP